MNDDNSLQRYHEADAEGKEMIMTEELMRLFAERLPNEDATILAEYQQKLKKEQA
jgi:hypothetical protein